MITDKIKALFQFIEYLHSNIETFSQYNDLIKELEILKTEKKNLSPQNNYKDKLKYDEIQVELDSKFKTLQDNTANLIKNKATELNLCNFDNEPNYGWHGITSEVQHLKKDFRNEDLPEIFQRKSQYLEYRNSTHKTFLSLRIFFNELDKKAKSLFDFFKDNKHNEFEPFETKAIQASSIEDVIKGFKQGQTKFTLPNSFLFNHSQRQQQEKAIPPQQNTRQTPELTINQIALKYVYSEQHITRENSNEVVKQYGHNSGDKLFQRYSFYSSAANRKGKPMPCTPKKLQNKIELLETILNLVQTDKKSRIIDEVSILKKIQEAEYL